VVDAPVAKIAVPETRLREMKDYEGLAASMAEIGLLQPITITEAGVLVSGRHRLEAARSLGWETIPAVVVEDDDLLNRLAEIDENLQRFDLTVYEQSKHAEERETVLAALGRRRKAGRGGQTAHGERLKTTGEVAAEAGMSEASWRRRTKIGKSLGPRTKAVLDHADTTDEKQRNFLNSTTQLNTLADISNKRGDEKAAEVAERVLGGGARNVYEAYPEIKTEADPEIARRREAVERAMEGVSFNLSPAQKAYYRFAQDYNGLRRLDPEEIAAAARSADEAREHIEDIGRIEEFLSGVKSALARRATELSGLRRVK
jgi:ParB-like chromosome segregation protein Spo0J